MFFGSRSLTGGGYKFVEARPQFPYLRALTHLCPLRISPMRRARQGALCATAAATSATIRED